MGKGDKKSKRGKIAIGSYGNSRRRKKRVAEAKQQPDQGGDTGEPSASKPRKTARKKTEA